VLAIVKCQYKQNKNVFNWRIKQSKERSEIRIVVTVEHFLHTRASSSDTLLTWRIDMYFATRGTTKLTLPAEKISFTQARKLYVYTRHWNPYFSSTKHCTW